MNRICLSSAVAKHALRALPAVPAVCTARRSHAGILPYQPATRTASSSPASAPPSLDDAPSSSPVFLTAEPPSPAGCSSTSDSSPTLDPPQPNAAAPSTSSAKRSRAKRKEPSKAMTVRLAKQKSKEKQPRRAANPSPPSPLRQIEEEGESFLPVDWRHDLESALESLTRESDKRHVARASRTVTRKHQAQQKRLMDGVEGKEQREVLSRASALILPRMVQMMLDGFMSRPGVEMSALVDEANRQLREFESQEGLSTDDYMYSFGNLRVMLLKYAYEVDHVKDAEGRSVIGDDGLPVPGPLQAMLRDDRDMWDRFVDDPDFLFEEESFDTAVEILIKRKLVTRILKPHEKVEF